MTDEPATMRTHAHFLSERGPGSGAAAAEQTLGSCEARLIACIRNDWALAFGSREVRLIIEYQEGVPVLIRVTASRIKEEKLK